MPVHTYISTCVHDKRTDSRASVFVYMYIMYEYTYASECSRVRNEWRVQVSYGGCLC